MLKWLAWAMGKEDISFTAWLDRATRVQDVTLLAICKSAIERIHLGMY